MTRSTDFDERMLQYLQTLASVPESDWETMLREELADDLPLQTALLEVLDRASRAEAPPPIDGLLRADAQDEALPETIGPYAINGRVGAGGMGVVLRTQDPRTSQPLALKLIPLAIRQDGAARQRFEREITALQRLQHPNIVPILDWGMMADGSPYLVMPEIPGADLQSLLDAADATPPSAQLLRQRVQQLARIAAALEHAHRRGVVHRDLKPSNILVDPGDEPHLLDFGVAHLADATRITRTGAAAGSPTYMAPEQLRGEQPPTASVDVYGLGATLYHALAGCAPFQELSLANMAEAKRRRDPPPLRQRNPAVPADLVRICERAMAYRPADRYPDMATLREDLEAVLDFRSIRTRALGPWTRLRRRLQRRPVVGVALAAAAMLLLVLAGMSWREHRSHKRSELRIARSVADSLRWHALLEAQAGNHERALELCDLALVAGAPDPLAVRIARVEILERSLRSPEAAEALRACLEEGEGGPHEARLSLLDAYLRAGPAPHEMWRTERLRRQLPHLEPADHAFALAVLSLSLQDSLAQVEECLRLDPFHALASDLQTNLLLITGRISEATAHAKAELQRFPHDPAIQFRTALCHAIAGDEPSVQAILAHSPIDPARQGLVDFGVRAGRARRLFESHLRDEVLGRESPDVESVFRELFVESAGVLATHRGTPEGGVSVRVTPAIVAFFAVPFARVALAAVPPLDPVKLSAALCWASEQSGDPHWYFVAGLGYREAQAWNEAARYFARAGEVRSSLFSSAQTRALYLIEACSRTREADRDPDTGRSLRELGREALGRALDTAGDDAPLLRFLFQSAVHLQDEALALRAALRWRKVDPDDPRAAGATKLAAKELLAAH